MRGVSHNPKWAYGDAGGTWLTWVSAARKRVHSTAQLLAQRRCCPAHLPAQHLSGAAAADAEHPSPSLILPGAMLPAACHCSSHSLAQNPWPFIGFPALLSLGARMQSSAGSCDQRLGMGRPGTPIQLLPGEGENPEDQQGGCCLRHLASWGDLLRLCRAARTGRLHRNTFPD